MISLAWRDCIGEQLLAAAGGKAILNEIKQEVIARAAKLWAFAGPRHVGYVVTRAESVPWGRELVIVLGQGFGAKNAIKQLIQYALKHEFESMRVHVKRPGLMRIFSRFDFGKVGTDADGYTVMRRQHGRA